MATEDSAGWDTGTPLRGCPRRNGTPEVVTVLSCSEGNFVGSLSGLLVPRKAQQVFLSDASLNLSGRCSDVWRRSACVQQKGGQRQASGAGSGLGLIGCGVGLGERSVDGSETSAWE